MSMAEKALTRRTFVTSAALAAAGTVAAGTAVAEEAKPAEGAEAAGTVPTIFKDNPAWLGEAPEMPAEFEDESEADIVVVAAGRMESIGKEYFSAGQTVLDVGIGWNPEKNKLCGDVKYEEVNQIAGAITPVPGGVGTVTTSVLMKHTVRAAMNQAHQQ